METLVRRHHGSSLSGATFAAELFIRLEKSKNLMLRQRTGSGRMVGHSEVIPKRRFWEQVLPSRLTFSNELASDSTPRKLFGENDSGAAYENRVEEKGVSCGNLSRTEFWRATTVKKLLLRHWLCSIRRRKPERLVGAPCRTEHRCEIWAISLLCPLFFHRQYPASSVRGRLQARCATEIVLRPSTWFLTELSGP